MRDLDNAANCEFGGQLSQVAQRWFFSCGCRSDV
ncbi:MAG: hypothetical protein ACI9KE_006509 [Polyangiales bacterium]|jgi:hypothetical protein